MRGVVRVLLVALPVGLLAAATMAQEKGNAEAATLKNPVASSAESIAAGEAIYNRRCRGCHGKEGTGGSPKEAGEPAPSNLVDDKWEHGGTDGEIFYTIRNGVPPKFQMEPWDDRLSEMDTWNVVNFIRTLKK